ncbi:MAG: teichoic acid transporter [Raoultibacter sp.]
MAMHVKKPDYVDSEEPIRYLDGAALSRPFELPPNQRLIAAVFLVIAIGIGGFFGFKAIDEVINAPARAAASVQENLTRNVALDLPSLPTLITYSIDDIRATFDQAGFTIYDMTDEEIAAVAVGLDYFKLPSDMTLADAMLLYSQGIQNLSAVDAAKILNGSWRMTGDWSSGIDLGLWYADFASGSIEASIQNAMVAEGFDTSTLGESGIDGSGNTYQSGTIDIDGYTYTWKISVCPLSGVYDVDGLPESANYVGIRLLT